MGKKIIGLDIGGTTIKIAILDEDAKILFRWIIPTNHEDCGAYILEEIWQSVSNRLNMLKIKKNSILGIGVGAPGLIDDKTGIVLEAVNIGWANYHLIDDLKELSQLPVFLENDANLAALGENWKGGGKKARNMITVTLGTGVGCGIIANGEILHGANGTAGEIGHVTMDAQGYLCNCGRVGCLDTIASATGIVHQALDIIQNEPKSDLARYYRKKSKIDAKDIFVLAESGDFLAKEIVEHTSEVLGRSLAFTATIINPTKIILGGGVSAAGKALLHKVSKYFHQYTLPRISAVCNIEMAQLGNDAGIIGAVYLVEKNLNDVVA
ncbi:MAG: ROK family glucokinase [Sporolactobacillus sp.]